MVLRADAPLRIEYPRKWFVIGLCLYAVLMAVLVYFFMVSIEGFLKVFWLVVGTVVGVLMFLFLVPPLFTNHLAGQKGVSIRMGLLVNAVVPYTWIRDVRTTTIARPGIGVGVGVRYSAPLETLFVTSSFGNLVVVKLDEARSVGRPWRPKVSQIVLSVSDVNSCIDTLRDRAGVREGA